MKENFIKTKPFKTLAISQGLTGKMAGMPAITTSLLCNENCKKLSNIIGISRRTNTFANENKIIPRILLQMVRR